MFLVTPTNLADEILTEILNNTLKINRNNE